MSRAFITILVAAALVLPSGEPAAQTIQRPVGGGPALGGTGAIGGTLGGTGGAPNVGGGTTAPDLRPTLPLPQTPKVIIQQPARAASPPRAAGAPAPDAGDSECDCYRLVAVQGRDARGMVTTRQERVKTGERKSSCCPR